MLIFHNIGPVTVFLVSKRDLFHKQKVLLTPYFWTIVYYVKICYINVYNNISSFKILLLWCMCIFWQGPVHRSAKGTDDFFCGNMNLK